MQAPAIEIRPFKNVDLSGGVVIEAFPSVGLVSAVTGMYIISSLKLDQIAAMDSAWFPPVSVIYAQKPKFPARIYASGHHKIAVCLSEFTMPAYFDRPIAKSILSWAKEQRCSLVISLCGIPVSEEEGNMKRDGVAVLGVGSTDQARQILKDNGISQLDSGVVPGITGALLNEGEWNAANVIALIVEAYSEVPDARAVAAIVEAIDMLLPQIGLEVSPLYVEAERIESRLRTLREQARPARPPIRPSPYA